MPEINERIAVLESNSKNLFSRLYGNGIGGRGDVPEILDKLDSLRKAHWMMIGAATLITLGMPLVIFLIEQYFHSKV